jgi:hypothetical protein
MRRIFLGVSIVSLAFSAALANTVAHPAAYDEFIARQAKKHGVPERLVHRILMRESRYDPKVFHNHCYGLMQIKYGTARLMGFNGAPKGLFDPYVNMTYAIPYLANAYRVADGDEDRAVALFAGGYYYAAKNRHLLAALRTADSPPLAPEPPPPAAAPPRNAMADLFGFLQSPAQSPVQPAQVEVTQPATQPTAQAAQASPAPSGEQQAAAEQAPPAQDATASISAPSPHPADAKSRDKAGSQKAAHPARTKIALAEPAAAPDGAKAVPQPPRKTKEARAHAISTAAASPARDADAPPATGAEKAPGEAAPGGAQ